MPKATLEKSKEYANDKLLAAKEFCFLSNIRQVPTSNFHFYTGAVTRVRDIRKFRAQRGESIITGKFFHVSLVIDPPRWLWLDASEALSHHKPHHPAFLSS